MNTLRPGWSRVGGVLVSVMLATSAIFPTGTLAATAESVDKAETVHVQTTATGEVTGITVQDTLANGDKADELADRTTLTDIDPGKDGPTYTQGTDGSLSWAAKGEQVSYEGVSTQEPPVRIVATYTLDGKKVQPEQLAGASGHLVIRLDYHNDSSQMRDVGGSKELIYTPFVCMTVATLDSSVFSNVQVKNGRVIDDKGGLAVIGYALPGLKESLDLDDDIDLDIPTYVQLEADVTDLSMDPIYTIVTPELFSGIDTSDLDLGDMGDGTGELQDAMDQLVQGSGTLTDALRKIATGADSLNGGVQEFRKKIGLLPDGLTALATGASTLAEGLDQTYEASKELVKGSEALPQASEAASASVTQGQESLATAAEKVSDAATATGAVGEAAKAVDLDAASNAANEVINAAGEVQSQAQNAASALAAAEPQVSGKDEALEGIASAEEALAGLDQLDTEGMKPEQIAAIQGARQQIQDKLDAAKASVDAISASVDVPDLGGLNDSVDTLGQKADALGSTTVDLSTVVDKSGQAQTAIGEASEAVEGASQALGATKTVLDGLDQATTGVDAGVQGLSTALGTASKGAGELATQLGETSEMGTQIVSGVEALGTGIEQLSGALSAATNGSEQLTGGLQTFNDEGITKVVEALQDMDGDLGDAKGRIEALRTAADEYSSFAGKADGQSGSVRFIFKSEQIG